MYYQVITAAHLHCAWLGCLLIYYCSLTSVRPLGETEKVICQTPDKVCYLISGVEK